ncbi:RICIN domain-containing protein [Streptomyces sp. NPDC059447]|uniref:RICIN domain-containing protein n=1 Tax=Streptomyces sp. NPDC059447 TaxID=3346834 RepID=UPI00367751FF
MFRRIGLALGSIGLLATVLTGTASAEESPAPQQLGQGLPKVISPAEAESRIASGGEGVASGDAFAFANRNSGKCLVVQGRENGKRAMQYTCGGFWDQRWYLVGSDLSHVQVQNANSGKCLVAQGYDTGAQAFQYTCGNYEDQFWMVSPSGDGGFNLSNRNSLQCLVVQGMLNGAIPFQYHCENFKDQIWYVPWL